jgi:UDP-N-acetylmuramoyl-L-alanyl-D-glutamate--2,6-diaminopimelate ligase
MTWDELRGALRKAGLHRIDEGVAADTGALFVTGLAWDSRAVEPGNVFIALKGLRADGNLFATQAVSRGAVAIVSEEPPPANFDVPWVTVPDARLALALLAITFYGNPSAEMRVVGITGTNGKTTTAYLLASIFEAAGIHCGIVGTVAHKVGDELREATRTTPEAPEIQGLLRDMVAAGCRGCAMEVSSHGLSLRRVDGITFAAAVFTNLTRDHLDFHLDMDAYFQAKRRLFEMLPREAPGVINLDDPRGAGLVELVTRPVSYAVNRPADVTTGPLSFSLEGMIFDVRTPRGPVRVRSSLVGRPNVYNILAAVAAATALDVPIEAVEKGIQSLKGVPGRFQLVSTAKDEVTVVVDYAHTDDALRNLLETARPLATGRLITLFGCAGDRDRTKRPLMGAVAGRLSDVVVITSDNPRTEDPNRIVEEVRRGLTADLRRDSAPQVLSLVDRREAIARAVELARPGDLVIIAGKGHEKYQVIGDRVIAFDDAVVAREALARRRSNSGVV